MQKTVLITGVSSGIGEATAIALAEAGHRVFGGARSPEKVRPMPNVELVRLDVREDDQARCAVEQVVKAAGRIDVLVNNAGMTLMGPVEVTSDAEALALFETNLFGALRLMRAALPQMRGQKSGLIVNVSSVLGFLPAPFMGLYASSKHALEGLSESLDHEVRAFGVRVVLVEPSFTNTNFDANAARTEHELPEYRSMMAQTVAALRRQIAEAPAPDVVASKILKVVNGKYRPRQPADARAKFLSVLKRLAPASQLDKGVRATFGLKA